MIITPIIFTTPIVIITPTVVITTPVHSHGRGGARAALLHHHSQMREASPDVPAETSCDTRVMRRCVRVCLRVLENVYIEGWIEVMRKNV